MSGDSENPIEVSGFASPPCSAAEIAPSYFDPLAVDPQQARDVTRWRVAARKRLRSERQALTSTERRLIANALATHVTACLDTQWNEVRDRTVSFYWPIKDEPDLRPLMHRMHAQGWRIALPVVETRAAPLVFRGWDPATRMARGHWNIPVPPPTAAVLQPDVVIAPLVGWDELGYRLGYGGGYFDRTLAAIPRRPFVIGTGFASARLATIFPQPHDIPMHKIVTETGVQFEQRT